MRVLEELNKFHLSQDWTLRPDQVNDSTQVHVGGAESLLGLFIGAHGRDCLARITHRKLSQ